MISLVTATIAGVLVFVYLGYYAVTLNRAPLWIVIVAVLAMVITDFVLTVRGENRRRTERKTEQNGGE